MPEQKQLAPVAICFWKKIYVFKKQSAAPDPVKNLLFTGTDHTRAEKYQSQVLLEWDRISGRILHRLKVFFFYSNSYDISRAVEGVF